MSTRASHYSANTGDLADLTDVATALIHHPYQPPGGFETVQPGVHKASTVLFENTAALKTRQWKDKSGYTYGLHGTPTTFTLEERLATLEGGLQRCWFLPVWPPLPWSTWRCCARVTRS
jgi:cystathionine beta-lyase/cystathionine gamma-synthase